ncbi:hypothetical protein [Paraburkholderia sp. Ac-20347]|uniref:hypothetical protein n=1 Tax=Paraburkholderia sp. Ac-20347 TaxID=2703892 RepID=UPI00197D2109|nr:hypothetical protein [Paraburkholderia sp. Ac-20347]MBN3813861.1 hypothetical protein [Paraburkholderia sp. Ac-20347]
MTVSGLAVGAEQAASASAAAASVQQSRVFMAMSKIVMGSATSTLNAVPFPSDESETGSVIYSGIRNAE